VEVCAREQIMSMKKLCCIRPAIRGQCSFLVRRIPFPLGQAIFDNFLVEFHQTWGSGFGSRHSFVYGSERHAVVRYLPAKISMGSLSGSIMFNRYTVYSSVLLHNDASAKCRRIPQFPRFQSRKKSLQLCSRALWSIRYRLDRRS
jgi:hypothetical protein